MQRKGRKYKDKLMRAFSSTYHTNISNKLHSIPKLKKNVKSNVVYSIPGVCMLVLCLGLVGLLGLLSISTIMANSTYAKVPVATGGSDSTPSLSLSLSNVNSEGKLVSNPTTPGSTVTVSTDVTVDVSNAEDYSLTLAFDNTTLVNGNTTISGINTASSTLSDNTWGYKWDNASSYTTPSTSGTTLTSSTNPTSGTALSTDGSVNFTKTLTFGVKFSDKAEAGTYTTKGALMLAANPKATTLGIWSTRVDSGITTMQEMTPSICSQVSTPTAVATIGGTNAPTLTLADTRDNNTYTIAKLPDGKCWMTSNLKLQGNINLANPSGNALTPNDTNISTNWTLPTSLTDTNLANDPGDGCSKNFYNGGSTSNTNCYYKVQSYINSTSDAGETGYYSYAAATAGWATSSISSGEASQSICPKGWKLPSGGRDSANTEYYTLFNSMNLGFPSISTAGYTAWSTSSNADARLVTQSSPYNFVYTGYADNGSFYNGSAYGYWWSSTVTSASYAYSARIYSSGLYAGTNLDDRYFGFAVRCVAADPDLTEITTMQEMTPRVCEKSATGVTNTLTDTRDGSTYTVQKMADGKCWMTQNLHLSLSNSKALTPADTNIASNWTPTNSTLSSLSSSDFSSSNHYKVESYIATPNTNAGSTGYYSYAAATAGTTGYTQADDTNTTIQSSGTASGSICPKGWRLPTGGSSGEFQALYSKDSTSSNGIRPNNQAPWYYTGYAIASTSLSNTTTYGYWWSSTVSNNDRAYDMSVNSSGVLPATTSSRFDGFAVRCVAQ